MYVSCRANELSRFLGHEVKGHGLIMYAKIACERILIRTDRWITIYYLTQDILQSQWIE